MNEKREILKKLKVEEDIWLIYLLIIGLSFYSNSVERKYYINDDLEAKEKYRKINILIFLIALIIYIYFFNDSYNDIKNLSSSDSYDKRFFNKASFTASTLILISGTILLFIAIYDENLSTELAFS